MTAVLAVGFAVVTGCLAVRLIRPARGLAPRWAALMLEISLGAGAGVALSSTVFFLLLLAGAASRWVVLSVELALFVCFAALLRFRREPAAVAAESPPAPPGFRWNGLLIVVLAGALLLVLAAQVDTIRTSPYGNWDAFAIWNLRAKFLLGPGETWRNAVSPLLERTQPEYPLLLSAFIARTWRLAGGVCSPAAPLATALLFFGSVMALLLSSLALLRGLSSGLLACLVVIATTSFMRQTTWQYADIPIGFYYLATLALVFLSATADGRRRVAALAMAGACASFAALTKDEGIPFLILSFGCYLLIAWRMEGVKLSIAKARYWIAGALPGILLLGYFKLLLAPPASPLAGQTASEIIGKLGDPGRYGAVLGALFSQAVALGEGFSHPLILLVILAIVLRFDIDRRRRSALLFGALTLALVFLSYGGVYLVTRDDLAWRLGTSLSRLYTQLWPSLLLLGFLVLGVARDEQPPEAASKAKHSDLKRKKRRSKRR